MDKENSKPNNERKSRSKKTFTLLQAIENIVAATDDSKLSDQALKQCKAETGVITVGAAHGRSSIVVSR